MKHLTAVAALHAGQEVKWRHSKISLTCLPPMPPKRKCQCCPIAEDEPSVNKFNGMLLSLNLQRKYQRDNSWPTRTGDRLADIEAGMQYLKDLIEEKQQDFYLEVSNIVAEEAANTDQLDEVREDLEKNIGSKVDKLELDLVDATDEIEDLKQKLEGIENRLKSQ